MTRQHVWVGIPGHPRARTGSSSTNCQRIMDLQPQRTYKKFGSFHETAKVVNSLFGEIWLSLCGGQQTVNWNLKGTLFSIDYAWLLSPPLQAHRHWIPEPLRVEARLIPGSSHHDDRRIGICNAFSSASTGTAAARQRVWPPSGTSTAPAFRTSGVSARRAEPARHVLE
jgi:hypothetical protein